MKKIAVLLLALVGGCGAQFFNPYYDRPNPWRTESDRERYLDKKEEDWLPELRQPYELPQNGGVAMTLPDLEAFRDTVLLNADAMVLLRIRDQSARKARMLQAR